MAHVRIQVRDAVAAQLGALPALAGRVNVMDDDPAQPPSLPLVYVEAGSETVARLTSGPPSVRRVARVITCRIAITDKGATPVATDDALEALAVAVEKSLIDLPALTPLDDIRLTAMEKGVAGEGETELGVLNLAYDITVHTTEADPETLV